jgi:HNH endonuclease
MRPVERGPWPQKDNINISFGVYGEARRFLIDNMGQYCSYCEQYLPTSLAVEHVYPKSSNPALEKDWNNFLLGCTNCNSVKGKKDIEESAYVWPDKHNTFLAFIYDETGIPKPNPILDTKNRKKAINMIALTGLDRTMPKPGSSAYMEASDRRWENRVAAWQKATDILNDYINAPQNAQPHILKLIPDVASKGFWSVWMTVFENHQEVLKALINGFKGTANCFDDAGKPLPRNSNDL